MDLLLGQATDLAGSAHLAPLARGAAVDAASPTELLGADRHLDQVSRATGGIVSAITTYLGRNGVAILANGWIHEYTAEAHAAVAHDSLSLNQTP